MGFKSLLRDVALLYISYNMIFYYPLSQFTQVFYAIIIGFFVLYFAIGKVKGS